MLYSVVLAWAADPTRTDAVAALTELQEGLARFDYDRVEARVLARPGESWPARRFELVTYALEGRLSPAAVAALGEGEWGPARGRLSDRSIAQLAPAGTDPAQVWLLTRDAAAVVFLAGDSLRVVRLEHVEVLAPAAPPPDPVAAAPSPALSTAPTRADAVALLRRIDAHIRARELTETRALVLAPPGAVPEEVAAALPQLVSLGELDEQGTLLLSVHGVWGPAAAVIDPGLLGRRAALLGIDPGELWALALGDARAIFGWDGVRLRLAYADDIGRLGRSLGLLPLGTPGVADALSLVARARGQAWAGPAPRWDFATRALGAETTRGMALRFGVPADQILVLQASPPLAFRWDGATLTLLDTWKAEMGR